MLYPAELRARGGRSVRGAPRSAQAQLATRSARYRERASRMFARRDSSTRSRSPKKEASAASSAHTAIAPAQAHRASARQLLGRSYVSHRHRTPRRLQQPGQTMSSKCSRSVRAHLPHVGHSNHDHEPPLGNRRRWMLTFCSTWPSWTQNIVVSAVMTPVALRREMETAGRSSRYLGTTTN